MRTILLSLSTLVLSGGLASAEAHHGNSTHGTRGGSYTQPTRRTDGGDHRGGERRGYGYGGDRHGYDNRRFDVRDHRSAPRVEYVRNRPIVRQRYYDYRVRPQVIVENVAPQDGYIWVAGQWQWNGYEWLWTDGHYDLATSYDGYNGYNGYDGYDGYDPGY